jgi:hypothetical protein
VFPQNLPVVPWYYLTSMGESFAPFYKDFVEWLRKNPEVKLAFNPGTWQFRAGTQSLKDILSLTQVIFRPYWLESMSVIDRFFTW